MKIGDLAQCSGLSIDTIRYYEKIGLLPPAHRDRSGHRRYDGGILSWIKFVERMKASGMPIKDIINYTALWKRGSGTEAERRELLEKQRQRVQARIAELRSCQRVIDEKVLNLIKLERG